MKKKFYWQKFVSLSLFLSFLVLIISGFVLYIAPSGSFANWIDWRFFRLNKDVWQLVHSFFSFWIIFLSVLHFIYHSKKILNYCQKTAKKTFSFSKEFIVSFSITLFFLFATSIELAPFSLVMTFADNIAKSWDKKNIPITHAEKLRIKDLSEKNIISLSSSKILKKLYENKIKVKNENQTILEIAKDNKLAPYQIYEIINKTDNGS